MAPRNTRLNEETEFGECLVIVSMNTRTPLIKQIYSKHLLDICYFYFNCILRQKECSNAVCQVRISYSGRRKTKTSNTWETWDETMTV
jgi:hypothetical protein